jgi:hypothetical protein
MRPVRAIEVCTDVVDPVPVAAFWGALHGYTTTDDPADAG